MIITNRWFDNFKFINILSYDIFCLLSLHPFAYQCQFVANGLYSVLSQAVSCGAPLGHDLIHGYDFRVLEFFYNFLVDSLDRIPNPSVRNWKYASQAKTLWPMRS